MVAETDVLDLKMSIEDAFKVVISGGIVNPGNVPIAALSADRTPVVAPPLASVATPIVAQEDNL